MLAGRRGRRAVAALLLLLVCALLPCAEGNTWNIFDTRVTNSGGAGSFAGTIVRGAGGGFELTIEGLFTQCPAGHDP